MVACFDKFVSVSSFGLRRVSERSLLMFAACGGFPGASVAFVLTNHKTRKQSFRHAYVFAVGVHVLVFFLFWQLGGMRYIF
jgi:uncharacterized membrane protein YsdA (DUF1294 family)